MMDKHKGEFKLKGSSGSIKTDIFENSFCDGVLHGHVHQLDVLRVRGARRLNKDLSLIGVRVPESENGEI